MGIPKFFRWMSERYPMCSQLITQNSIPEFDNMYLDMNGIIHNCSHNNNNSAHYRISEEEIWIGVFNYVDHLFAKIKPKKLFFMAIDGVAPRAKMNQQRSRRFRTAQEAQTNRNKALKRGEELPDEPPFDSNCITPGTEFMAKLTAQLRYFIAKKVSEDANWRGVEIVLSGPEVPGEGEHKIMEYIRLAKAQPEYNPNTRHCLYGLDADLIMLGLLSHDPHFALLREEVTFGRKAAQKKTSLDSQNFYLMHLSLLREYLDLEFVSMKATLPFEYDLERVIDDFILLALFVGNDFLPHLPSLHIHDGALGLMFNIYKNKLPESGGYLQDGGVVNLHRLQPLLDELTTAVEMENFDAERADMLFLAGKRWDGASEREQLHNLEKKKKGEKTITETQKKLFGQIKEFILEHSPANPGQLHFPSNLKARDRRFIEVAANDFNLHYATEYSNEDNSKHVYIEFEENEEGEEDVSEEEMDEEALAARDRVLAKYETARVIKDELTEEELYRIEEEKYYADHKEWKRQYYQEKMDVDIDNEEQMDKLCREYITGIQWVLRYYYNGVASWGWFFPYHYAPKISDLKNIEKYQDVSFDLGRPFRPYEQLMGVLPTLSKQLLPVAYRELMTSTTSPILDFYPSNFDMDLNGKKQDWEAVVRIPFIDEKRLLEAMKTYEHRLTKSEKKRSQFGESYSFIYDKSLEGVNEGNGLTYPSPLPGVFPDVYHCVAREVVYHLPTLENGLTFKKHLCDGAYLGKDLYAGFPSLNTIPHTGEVTFHKVIVFQGESRNETMVVTLNNQYEDANIEEIAKKLLYRRVYVHYPYLKEAVIIGVSDRNAKYYVKVAGKKKQILQHMFDDEEKKDWEKRVGRVEYMSSKRFGLVVGKTEIALHVCTLRGMKKTETGAYVKEYVNPAQEDLVPIQTSVLNITNPDERYKERPPPPIDEEFPVNSKVFFTGRGFYGSLGTVLNHKNGGANIALIVPQDSQKRSEPGFGRALARQQYENIQYFPFFAVCEHLNIDTTTVGPRFTSSMTVQDKGLQRINLGLNLKFENKQQKVIGYSRKNDRGHVEYSVKAIELIVQYIREFPNFVSLIRSKKGNGMLAGERYGLVRLRLQGDPKNAKWLKEKKINELPRASLAAEELEEDFVKEIEKCADEYNRQYDKLQFKKMLIQNVPRTALLKPADAEMRLHTQTFKLGDRVVYALEAGVVPLGFRGTVVGVQETIVDVVFDSTFMGGTNLDGKCSDYRGLSLSYSNVINLTYPSLATPTARHHHDDENHASNGHFKKTNEHTRRRKALQNIQSS